MLTQSARPSSRNKSSVSRRRSRALNRAILETLEPRTLLSGLDFSGGFANTGDLTVNGPAAISGSQLQLSGSNASAWSTAPRDITQFATSFTFQSVGAPGNFTFALQGNSNTAAGGGLNRTVALTFDLSKGMTTPFVNGRTFDPFNTGDASTGMNFNNNDTYNVTLSYPYPDYQGATLHQVITDTNTGATSTINYVTLDIPAVIGGGAAFVGFTGNIGSQNIQSWTYASPSIGNTPFAPSYLAAAGFPAKIVLDWTDNSANEDGFVIARSTNGSAFSDLASVPANTTNYIDSAGLARDTSYYYQVRAVNSSGSSVISNIARYSLLPPPLPPSGATATAVSANEVDLAWQPNGNDSNFRIYRRSGGVGDFALIGMVPARPVTGLANTFADTSAPSGTSLEYHIVAYRWDGDYSHDGESEFAAATAQTPSAATDAFGPAIALNGSAQIVGSKLQLTDDQAGAETGSAWSSNCNDVTQFTSQFSFRISNPDSGGFTFAVQDHSPTAIGSNRGLGYSETLGPINRAIGIQFYLGGPSGFSGGTTGLLVNGEIPQSNNSITNNSINVTSSGIDFRSGHTFNVALTYDRHVGAAGALLFETIVDASNGATFTHAYWVDIPWTGLDFVGFTGSKPAISQQGVDILSWSYSTNNQANPTTTFIVGNTAPVLTGTSNFSTITEDDLGGSDLAVDTLIVGHVTDSDGPAKGIAITALNSGNGTWQYTTNGGATWLAIGAVSETSALLLDDPHHIRFVPDGKNGTTATVTFRAWDESNGANLEYTYADVATNGGSTPYSAATGTASVTVTDVNDRPFFFGPQPDLNSLGGPNSPARGSVVIAADGTETIGNVPWVTSFPQITEDDLNNQGVTVSNLLGGRFHDVDHDALPLGIAAVGQANAVNSTQGYAGTWQYSLNSGGTWIDFGALTTFHATVLAPDARVRFKPNGQFGTNQAAGAYYALDYLMIEPWEQTDGSVSGQTGVNANPNDPTAAYGGQGQATQFIQDINDAPVLTGTKDFPTISEDAGDVSKYPVELLGNISSDPTATWSDVDPVNHGAEGSIAIIGQNPGNGTWQYDGPAGFTDIGAVSDTSALLINNTTRLRFVPDHKNGTTASLTFRAWDRSNGLDLQFSKVDTSVNGGTTPYSTATATAHVAVTDLNDSPVLNGAADFPAITEDDLNNNGQTVAALIAGQVSDVDHDTLSPGIAVAGVYQVPGLWQYSLDGGSTWNGFGPVSESSATVLGPDARVRLQPNGQYGTASGASDSIYFFAWDRSDGLASGTTGVNVSRPAVDPVTGSRISSFSGGAITKNIFVIDVNDAPVLNGVEDFPTIRADDVANNGIFPNGLSTFILGHETDVDLEAPYTGNAHNTRAVAVVGQNAGNGTWQYHNGLAWTNIGAVSNTSALLITGQPVRFVPNGHDGTTASLTLRAWDGYNNVEFTGTYVDVSINGGSTPYSTQTATTHINVTPTIVTSSLTVTAPNSTYNAHPYADASATVTPAADSGAVTFTYYTAADTLFANPIPAPTNAGTYQVVGHLAAIAGYTAADSVPATFTIAKADALISVSGFTGTYTATPHGATGTATGVGGVDLSAQLSLGASFTNAPGGTANWSFSGGINYNDATGTAIITIAKASLTGIASTQDALNIAKQGSFTIDINSITGLQSGDTVVSIFNNAIFSLTIGANTYLFAPTVTVDAITQTIHVAYSLKAGTASADNLRADLLALDAADGTLSTSAAKTPFSTLWITADSLNYTFTDDFLTRLFSSK